MSASSAVLAESIPGLDKRYHHLVKPTPRKLLAVRASFKATMWFSAAEWVQLMSMATGLKNGKMSLYAFIRERLGLKGAKDTVTRAAQLAAVRGMAKPPVARIDKHRRKRRAA